MATLVNLQPLLSLRLIENIATSKYRELHMTTLTPILSNLKQQAITFIPVYRQRLADTETPLSVFAR